ncbi:unnamed protein product [Colletotrichum noveboracense]|uniref:NACHT-NTPase and P-loop NTPases N-terminal domain-containing protein n=1 Tax=Colletotrichum noveboracense TaxID=2664923 RepID=A0A9W4S557_9PEZI|nr:hypothetical protein K456DRAFT_383691 [Colletotrichum gloeosporioides 23]KAJ0273686.1 hypothetical protein COL940_009776 [Colletotrichum noveboracense]KAJ0279604.1 hypothetical protein CBS470a_009216 [Colletotrichum nupharicola]CAI0653121.1 unnamed protein product [Colletotrichum noveboracense]
MDAPSTAASTFALFEKLDKLFQIIKDINDLPTAIHRVGESFPIVLDVVNVIRDEPNSKFAGYVNGFLELCNNQAKRIGYIFNAIRKAMKQRSGDRDWSTFVDFYREKVREAGKVEALMESILQKLRNLAVTKIFKSLEEAMPSIDRMTEAIKAIKDAEPPLPDSDFNDSSA